MALTILAQKTTQKALSRQLHVIYWRLNVIYDDSTTCTTRLDESSNAGLGLESNCNEDSSVRIHRGLNSSFSNINNLTINGGIFATNNQVSI